MTTRQPHLARHVSTVLVTATVVGVAAGAIAAGFIWLIEEAVAFMWVELPEHLDVDAFDSWWLFALPVVGGALVGVGQRTLGNYPRSIDEAIVTWRAGGRIPPTEAPRTAVNSLVALAAGGPVGFEAALTGVLGGTATWVGQRIRAVDEWSRGAWTDDEDRPTSTTGAIQLGRLPYWVAGIASLFTFRWLPFGELDMGFRFTDFGGELSVGTGAAAVVVAATIAPVAMWAIATVHNAEHAMHFQRSPILAGMGGGLAIALLAMPNELVLFSGQQGIQLLPDADTGDLLYLAVAKWLALVLVLYAGWRGGPIFPTYTSAAALAVAGANVFDLRPDVMIVAALAAVGVVFLRGNVPVAALLTLYAVDFSYTAVIILGCVGAALSLAVVESLGGGPTAAGEAAAPEDTAATVDDARPGG